MAETVHIQIEDNSGLVKEEMRAACLRALEKCGLTAEGYAKLLCPVDTGNLRNSITHQVDEGGDAVYIGTNSEYGAYVIDKRNLEQESIILVAVPLLGCTKTHVATGTLRTVSARSRTSNRR